MNSKYFLILYCTLGSNTLPSQSISEYDFKRFLKIESSKLLNKCAMCACKQKLYGSEAEFKEFEPRLKYGWFHLKLY